MGVGQEADVEDEVRVGGQAEPEPEALATHHHRQRQLGGPEAGRHLGAELVGRELGGVEHLVGEIPTAAISSRSRTTASCSGRWR